MDFRFPAAFTSEIQRAERKRDEGRDKERGGEKENAAKCKEARR